MNRHDEEFQDVEFTILPDHEQPVNPADSGNALPHFQFLDGGGTLQSSTDRPSEGFVALKITYGHVFKKQREHTRVLQQKIKQLFAQIQQLKNQSVCSVCQEKVTKNPCDVDVQTELMHTCSNKEISELHFQLATLEAYKTKLGSGLVRLTGHLLKTEPLSDLLKRILRNLQSLDFDSEKSLKEFDSLIKEMGDLDDDLTQGQISQVPGLILPLNEASFLAKSSASSDSSSQQLITGCSKTSQDFHSETQKKPDTQKQHLKFGQMDREASQEEDMYGAENTLRNTDLVPYNLSRLRIKLMKLQNFHEEFRSMMQQLNASLEQQKIATSLNGNLSSYQRQFASETRPALSGSGLLHVPGEMSSLIEFHDIKVPPTDFSQLPTSQIQVPSYNLESPETTIHNIETVTHADHRQNRAYPFPGNVSPSPSFKAKLSGTDISNVKRHPIDGQITDEGFINSSCVKSDSPKGTLSLELVRGPPTTSQVTSLGKDTIAKWPSGFTGHVVPQAYQPPSVVRANVCQKEYEEQLSDQHTNIAIDHKTPSWVNSSANTECVTDPSKIPQPIEVPSSILPGKTRQDSKSSEWTWVSESSSQGPYMPGSDNVHDELATARGNMHPVVDSFTQINCPVCQQTFPPGTPEEKVISHVNLHFDTALFANGGYEILDS